MSALRGAEALLVIEIADTSLEYDMTTKATLYATHGVHEYWVINALTLSTTVFCEPNPSGYASVTDHVASDLIAPHLESALAVRLANLPIGD